VRRALERFLRVLWNGEAGRLGALYSTALSPLAGAYGLAMKARNRRHDRRDPARVPGVRVVSVGNLAVGGTGKTPLAAHLARRLAEQGQRPVLVSRGYGHDETLLHTRWNPSIPVLVGADRVHAVQSAAVGGATVAVLDDGFQHRALARDLDLVLLAAEDEFPGHLLPRGPYREPTASLARADAVIITRRTADAARAEALAQRVGAEYPHLVVGRLHLAPGGWQTLDGRAAQAPVPPVLAVAGVARPDAFATNVEEAAGGPVDLVGYEDHHQFTAGDAADLAARAGTRTVVVTEKDAVKLSEFSEQLPCVSVLVQELRWEAGEDRIEHLLDSRAGGLRE
jgi:tetraacyldisaccharide 4'-kinase